GMISFAKGEPFCFFNVVQNQSQDDIQPVIKGLETNPALKAEYEAWARTRNEFNESLMRREPEAMKEAWQKFYFKGEKPDMSGQPVARVDAHVNRRRLKTPKVLRPKR
ncbi:MAG: DUF6065 family protein, partial [Asticcacaulis sp.]